MDPVLEKMKEHLITKNVAAEIAEKLCNSVAAKLEGKTIGTFSGELGGGRVEGGGKEGMGKDRGREEREEKEKRKDKEREGEGKKGRGEGKEKGNE